ncbi:stage II sporulation protein P [Thermohalobacter berrensis]|uniref:Stage II sporulation protein P n=1 Tax=Thermohalobacter berrensis TaxID=99594 RepID=A0A419T060_9FIRM|nr:stage II sporulation protein P [Thermohalobacter berrensis]RKD30855.1 hypothetical protein BET03_13375 [Thermohalobacter berrensis]
MKRTFLNDRSFVYVIIAIICLIIFFIGYKIINKNKDAAEKTNEVVTTFNQNGEIYKEKENNLDNTNKNKKRINFFLKTFVKSNTYMELAYEMEGESHKDLGIINNIFDRIVSIIKPKRYLKSQLPAILNISDTLKVSTKYETINKSTDKKFETDNKNDKDTKETPLLKDKIIFIEDPSESEEGEMIENTNEEIAEDILSKIEMPKKINVNLNKPYILIYHTHGTEAYLPIEENQFHTTKRGYNVLTIGEIIKEQLSSEGHNINHVNIYHDIPSYSKSYYMSLKTVKEVTEKNKNIKIIFDIHRDGVPENASYLDKALEESKIKIDGKEVATFSLVIGPENPNREELIKFAKFIKAVSDSMYPGLCKGIIEKPYGKFNQYMSNYYALIEVGSNLNTIDEAKNSAKLIGNVLSKVINEITR